MNLLIIGTGYVGLVTGTCFAEMGHHVTCLDIDDAKIELLKQGKTPIYEPGLEELVTKNQNAHRLSFTTSYEEGLKNIDVCFIAVPTGSNPDGGCDLSHVKSAAQSIGKLMSGPLVIANKSTSPLHTTDLIRSIIQEELQHRQLSYPFDVVSNPEFLKEGCAIQDSMKPDRIIIGSDSQYATDIMKELYSAFSLNHNRILIMSCVSAELTKYAANVMLASRISLMNELSRVCDQANANIHDVRIGIGSDKRIGYHFLYAGVGYGGSCFPKDIKALKKIAEEMDIETPMLDAIELVNDQQKRRLSQKISNHFGDLSDCQIAIWGLSFKPDTDDIRHAPALQLIDDLLQKNATIKVYDPISMDHVKKHFPPSEKIIYAKSEYDAADNADAIALVTEWKQFRFVDLKKIASNMRSKVFFDGRNQYKPHQLGQLGFTYYGIGVPKFS
ncbi:MAG: UDP-glucose/GDP-mannose dehydrogenase family protein [Simkaniaceae bacterium]|nr:UDP-glucose/GDP-mannose dehydrogenase family protein [Simkaniaceae bacterium]MCF7851728.1 UDP-glucose/GDP-mannose dehydrogenase family protein [Simkaniaceae bacterium]